MRFTGQVKIPDLDYPGVPASVVIEGKQVELFVEGESLGRWSLVDVRAERLISSAFSLKLAGEEVTFIADQPTEFAYGGVEEMANVWARHRTMRLPRRIVANSRSRKGTKPSRVSDLRAAIEESLTGTAPTALVYGKPPVHKGASGVASLREPPARRESDSEVDDVIGVEIREPEAEPTPASLPEPATAVSTEAEPVTPSVDVPAAAAEAVDEEQQHRDPVPVSPDTPDVVLAEPEPEPVGTAPEMDSVFKDSVPWAKRGEDEVEEAPALEHEPSPPPPSEELPAGSPTASDLPTTAEPPPAPPPAPDVPAASVPWMAPSSPDDSERSEPEEPARPTASGEGEPSDEPAYVVDLGAFEDRDHRRGDDGERLVSIEPEPDEDAVPSLVSASARGGIMGAVRSAFVRNRVEHAHEYVEAPGGIGIKRQICAECGHISIGVE